MNIKLISIYGWSIGSNAKAKYFTAKEQNKDDIYFALREIVDSYEDAMVAEFSAYIRCNDNPNLNGVYNLSLYFNRFGNAFFKLHWLKNQHAEYLRKLQNTDSEKYDDIIQGLFDAIVATKEFKQFAQKATKNIQDCFKDVIDPLYRGIIRVSDELDINKGKATEVIEEDVRKAIKNLMRLKGRILSSSTLNLSSPEF